MTDISFTICHNSKTVTTFIISHLNATMLSQIPIQSIAKRTLLKGNEAKSHPVERLQLAHPNAANERSLSVQSLSLSALQNFKAAPSLQQQCSSSEQFTNQHSIPNAINDKKREECKHWRRRIYLVPQPGAAPMYVISV